MGKVDQERTTGAKDQVLTSTDTVGGYAKECGELELELIEADYLAMSERNYLAIAPCFF